MGIEQPYGDEPAEASSFIVKETVELDGRASDTATPTFEYWEFDVDARSTHRGRAIDRSDGTINLRILEHDELEYLLQGDRYWVVAESATGTSVELNENLTPGSYALVVESSGEREETVTVEFWRHE